MDAAEFRRRGREMVDFVADYMEGIREYRPLSAVKPGYLKDRLPDEAPQQPDSFDSLMDDVRQHIMPGVTHWQSPRFHAYFPTANSYAGTIADILSDTIACVGFSWAASPACTELEVITMDWLAKALDLPDFFLSGGKGGGVIQGTASEATLVALLAARSRIIDDQMEKDPTQSQADILGKLVVYYSDQAHSSVERACMLGAVRGHQVQSDAKEQMRGDNLAEAIRSDREQGLIPFYCVATLGTTPSCAFDKLTEIGPVCQEEGIWLHIDAAYAGSAFICPEFRHLMDGIQLADSFNFNPHKWMLVTFDCSALWFKNSAHVVHAFNVDPLYLKYKEQGQMPDYRHWQIPLGRRFRALKLWFVMRLYGITGIQKHIRKHVELAHKFEELVRADDRFTITNNVTLGLVCFRLKGKSNEINAQLLENINSDGRIHMVPSKAKDVYFLRFAICSPQSEETDIEYSWSVIKELASSILAQSSGTANGLTNGTAKGLTNGTASGLPNRSS